MREDAEVTLRHTDAHRDQFGSIDQLPLPPKQSWISTVHRRLSRANTLSEDLGTGDSATGTRSWADLATEIVGRRGLAVLATLFIVLLVISCTSTAMLLRSWSAEKSASANYLLNIAEWHASLNDGGGPPAYVDLDVSMRSCAKRIQLPPVQLPKQLPEVPAWQSNGSYPATPLDELAVNCTNPAEAGACQKAASSNVYEGGTAPLDSAELAELDRFLEAPRQQAESLAGQQDLDQLNLNCDANPEVCAAVAEDTNSYSSTTDTSDAAVAEAAEYLSIVNAHHAWDAVIGYAPQLGPDSANTYESAEHQWVKTRNAEEAGAQYLDISALDLECSKAAADSDVVTEAECERAVRVNKYETPAPTNQDPALTAAEIALSMQLRQRTEGYDAVALDWDDVDAQQPAPTADAEQPGAVLERILLQQQMLQDVAKSGRVTGYDVPALDDTEQISASTPAAGAPAAGPVKFDNRLGARQYFKQPCNCPAAQQEFKNRFSHPGHRAYYKNPANAPIFFAPTMGEAEVSHGPSAPQATSAPYLAALATIAASAAGTWYMFTRNKRRPAKPAGETAQGEGAEQLAATSPLASGVSCELLVSHFDLSTGRAGALHAASPAISDSKGDESADEQEEAYNTSDVAGTSSPKALIEGMTSGMLRRLRESDYGSDTVLEGPSNLQSRPSMVADVERKTEPRVRFATPSSSREAAASPFKQK